MTEFNNTFDIVLYYTRNTIVKPAEPTYQSVVDANPDYEMDDLLDIYSDVLAEHKKAIEKYNKTKHLNKTVESYVFISNDEKFSQNVHDFEQNDFFVKWTETSKNTIENTILECDGLIVSNKQPIVRFLTDDPFNYIVGIAGTA